MLCSWEVVVREVHYGLVEQFLRRRHAYLLAEPDAFLEMIEHRESGSTEPHQLNEIDLSVPTQSASTAKRSST
jgi:hypothetical protein